MMDENRPSYRMKAPAARSSGAELRLPGHRELPHVDDHLVTPEVSRDEIIGGHKIVASPAKRRHAVQHHRLDYVLGAKVARGYEVASDLLTRHDLESDFASDTALLKEGTDPQTGTRHLEEVVFEVVSEQSEHDVTEKARRMTRRGVRRTFAIFLKKGQIGEWCGDEGHWELLNQEARIEDICLVEPLEVEALLDAAAADDAVVSALVAKNNPRIARIKAEGKATTLLTFLEARSFDLNEEQRSRILATTDLAILDRWVRRAAVVDSVDLVFAGD